MNIKVPNCVHSATRKVVKNRSTLATGVGLLGFVLTTISAVKATPKALKLKEIAEDQKGEALTKTELIKTCWKPYVVPTAEGLLSIGCIVYGKKVDMNTIKSISAAYAVSEKTCGLLEDKLKETFTETYDMTEEAAAEKVEDIKEEIQNKVDDRPIGFPILATGEEYFRDPYLGTVFSSTEDKVEAAAGYVNKRIMSHEYGTLEDFYWHLGVEDNSGAWVLSERGWNDFTGPLEVSFGATLVRGVPVKSIRYKTRPVSV